MTHGSLFAGIGGFDLGFQKAGWKTVWQVEIDPFCRRVLEKRFHYAERFSDIRECGAKNLCPVDCITAGVPCQDVSIAGKREGLKGKRTGLFYQFARILCELRPAWFVFENVPGLLSSNQGRDLAEVYRVLMVRCGYGISRRCLNSQFFGVAQRRRRVFIVGSLGRPCPPEILFEPGGRDWHSAPGGEAGTRVAYALAAGSGGSKFGSGRQGQDTFVAGALGFGQHASGFNGQDANQGHIVTAPVRKWRGGDSDGYADLAYTLRESDGHHGRSSPRGDGCDNLVASPLSVGGGNGSNPAGRRREDDFNLVTAPITSGLAAKRNDQDGYVEHLVCGTLRGGGDTPGSHGKPSGSDQRPLVATLNSGGNDGGFSTEPGEHLVSSAADSHRVRSFARLPEGLDSARYRALGNAVTVQVAEWIGRRLIAVAKTSAEK